MAVHIDLIADQRQAANITYTLRDCYLSGFALFYLQDPSLWEFQRRFQRTIRSNNLSTVFGVEQIQAAIELPAKWQAYGEALFDLFGDTDFERLQDVYGRQTNRIMERVLRYFPMRRIRGASKSLADEVQGELDGRSPFRRSFVGRGFTHARQHLRGRRASTAEWFR